MDDFKDYLIREEKSELTVEKYVRDVRRFLLRLGADELTKRKVLEYKAELIASYAVASVNSILSSLNSYFTFIDRADCRVKAIKQQRCTFLCEEKELTKDEYAALVRTAEEKKN